MKIYSILLLFITALTSLSHAKVVTIDVPLETEKVKAEFYETSGKGMITLIGCSRCEQTQFSFDTPPPVYKNNVEIDFSDFMAEYWKAKYPTVFLNLEKTKIIKIKY